jgi:hypothetical protein
VIKASNIDMQELDQLKTYKYVVVQVLRLARLNEMVQILLLTRLNEMVQVLLLGTQ